MRYVLDGTIGCGKSTILRGLGEKGVPVFQEPIEKWEPVMKEFYTDPARNALRVNTMCMQDLHDRDIAASGMCVVERWLESAFHVFSSIARDQDMLTEDEFKALETKYMALRKDMTGVDTTVVYVHVSPETSIERLQRRGRSETNSKDHSYFRLLHQRYEAWYNTMDGNKVHTVDGEQHSEDVLRDVCEIVPIRDTHIA